MRIMMLGLLGFVYALAFAGEPGVDDRFAAETSRPKAKSPVRFGRSWNEARAEASRSGRRILIVFTGEHCGWCRALERRTLSDAEVAALSLEFVCVELDTGDEENARLVDEYRIDSIPRSLILGSVWQKRLQQSFKHRQPDHRLEVLRQLLEPRRQPSALLQPPDATLHHVATAVRRLVEPPDPPLIRLGRDHRDDPSSPVVPADLPRTVALVTGHPSRPGPRPADPTGYTHTTHHRLELGGLVPLSGGHRHRHRQALAVADQVDLRAEPAARPAQGVVGRLGGRAVGRRGSGRRPAGPDRGAVDAEQIPVHLAGGVEPHMKGFEQPSPGAVLSPAAEPLVDRLPGAIGRPGQVTPGGAGVENPEDAVDDPAVPFPGVARSGIAGQVRLDGGVMVVAQRVSELSQSRVGVEVVIRPLLSYEPRLLPDTA